MFSSDLSKDSRWTCDCHVFFLKLIKILEVKCQSLPPLKLEIVPFDQYRVIQKVIMYFAAYFLICDY